MSDSKKRNPAEVSKKDRKFSLRLEEEIDEPLRELSARFGVSTAFMARRLLRAGLRDQSKHCLILSDEDGQQRGGVI